MAIQTCLLFDLLMRRALILLECHSFANLFFITADKFLSSVLHVAVLNSQMAALLCMHETCAVPAEQKQPNCN